MDFKFSNHLTMKIKFFLLLLPILTACTHYRDEIILQVDNNITAERKNELIVIPRAEIEKRMGKFKKDEYLILIWQVITLPTQFDDLDKDGNWDELAFLGDFMPGEKIQIILKRTMDRKMSKSYKKTNIRFAQVIKPGIEYKEIDSATRLSRLIIDSTKKYPQFEGPGWENDFVAFRNYFDERNGIDIFGKAVSSMILDSVGIRDDYSVPQYWGMDILKVGNSLGAGALGIVYKDSLYRVSAIEGASFHIVAEGPVRSILDFDFKDLKIGDLTFNLKHRVSIVAGECGYRSSVSIDGPTDKLSLVSGIVRHCDSLNIDSTKNARILFTHCQQSVNGEFLGLGLIVNSKDYAGWFETPREGEGVINTYAVKMKFPENKVINFKFYAGWEITINVFADKKIFSNYMNYEAMKFDSPITYKFYKKGK